MTERLYYADPYQTRLAARVVEHLEWEGQPAVTLDRTVFYPTGGGQPHDTGTLDGIAVVDVVEREADGAVVHVLAAALPGREVDGRVDWRRRFDLMQQHTGQHILSAAFVQRWGVDTVGFHLSDEYTTIDLNRAPLSAGDLAEVEALANDAVFENRPVVARFVPDAEVPTLPLRKPLAPEYRREQAPDDARGRAPDDARGRAHAGPVRVVEIPGLDCSACGGTHVRATGEVGLIKIIRSERRGEETRVEFLCGGRALADYHSKNALLMDLAREFTVGHREVAELVHRLDGGLKETRRELRHTRDALLDAEAEALWHQAGPVGKVRVVRGHLVGRTPDDLKHLLQRLVARPYTVALLAAGSGAGEKGHFAFARSADLDLNVGALVRQACEDIGGRGGGRPEFAQGGGPRGEQVAQALEAVFDSVVDSIRDTRSL